MVFCNLFIGVELSNPTVSHNPYFNRWFSAMYWRLLRRNFNGGHNPYFNRWFSAIMDEEYDISYSELSQSLF